MMVVPDAKVFGLELSVSLFNFVYAAMR